jgi:hypothetical protein
LRFSIADGEGKIDAIAENVEATDCCTAQRPGVSKYPNNRKDSLNMKKRKEISMILTFVCIGVVGLGYKSSARSSVNDPQKPITIPEAYLPHTTAGAGATKPAKICSAVHALSFSWRDSIVVPDDWGKASCQNFAHSLGTTEYQLGCANLGSFSWGNRNGSAPADNQCKW